MPESCVKPWLFVFVIRNCVCFIKWIDTCKKNVYALYTRGEGVEGGKCYLIIDTFVQCVSQLSKNLHTESNLQYSPQMQLWFKGLTREWENELAANTFWYQ